MNKFARYFTLVVIVLYFFLGVYILVSPAFSYLTKEIKIIFSVFLFLYGGFRLARLWSKYRDRDEE
jgi:uncharacterized membrane protein